jgi:hypothetical protein
MTTHSEWVALARIRRPQGRKGEVFADLLTDFPEKFAERGRLWRPRSGVPTDRSSSVGWGSLASGNRGDHELIHAPRSPAHQPLAAQGRYRSSLCRRRLHLRRRRPRGPFRCHPTGSADTSRRRRSLHRRSHRLHAGRCRRHCASERWDHRRRRSHCRSRTDPHRPRSKRRNSRPLRQSLFAQDRPRGQASRDGPARRVSGFERSRAIWLLTC